MKTLVKAAIFISFLLSAFPAKALTYRAIITVNNIASYDVSEGIIPQESQGSSKRQMDIVDLPKIASIDKMDYIQKYSIEASNAELNKMLKMCNDDIKEYLKAPSTALFSNPEVTRFVDKGDGYYKIEGSLDSQNSYGAMIRDKYSCFAAHFGNGNISIYDTYLQSELERKVSEVERERKMIKHELEMMRIRLGY